MTTTFMKNSNSRKEAEMEELIRKLNAIPGSYFAFVAGISSYAEKKPERLQKVIEFIDSAENPCPSDIIEFISDQPDFHEYSAGSAEIAS